MNKHFVPELFVLGAIASGTTSLCSELKADDNILWSIKQSDFWPPDQYVHQARWKEPHYFDDHKSAGPMYMINDNEMCSLRERRVVVDGTTRNSLELEVPQTISEWYGIHAERVKFVFIIREPLARLHSHYHHAKQQAWCPDCQGMEFHEIVDKILAGDYRTYIRPNPAGCGDFLDASLYNKTLSRYFKFFKPHQFMLIPFLFHTDPGNNGRPKDSVVPYILRQLHMRVHASAHAAKSHLNSHPHPPLTEDLDENRTAAMQLWFAERTGPQILANILNSTHTRLYGYAGLMSNTTAIASWIQNNW